MRGGSESRTPAVGEHQLRLMEGADEILAAAGVDAGLAADGGIDLRQQRRRHLHDAHAAPDDRRCEAGEVADDAAAERDDDVVPLDARGEDAVDDLGEVGGSFSILRRAE